MGRFAPVILLVVAIVVALAASFGTYNWLKEKKEVRVVESVETVPVAVAVVDLYSGAVLGKDYFKMVSFMKGSLPDGSFFSDVSKLEGRVVVSPISAKEPILRSRLAPESMAEGGVPAVIKDNMRAMSVKVDQIIGVSGFIKPGDRVDVLVTLGDPEEKVPTTKIVLENMLILATGTQVQTAQKGGPATPVNVITLEVTPEEAEKIVLATTQGKIQLALRGYKDNKVVLTKGATIPGLLASFRPKRKGSAQEEEIASVEPEADSWSYAVWTINGNSVRQAKIK